MKKHVRLIAEIYKNIDFEFSESLTVNFMINGRSEDSISVDFCINGHYFMANKGFKLLSFIKNSLKEILSDMKKEHGKFYVVWIADNEDGKGEKRNLLFKRWVKNTGMFNQGIQDDFNKIINNY